MSWIKISNQESALFLGSKRYQNKQKTKNQLTTADGKSCSDCFYLQPCDAFSKIMLLFLQNIFLSIMPFAKILKTIIFKN